jgi:hypothetical protein
MARHYSEMYAGKDMRRAQECMDSGMIREDRSKMANMPQEVIIKEYAKINSPLPENLDDTESGIKSQIGADNSAKLSQLGPNRF